MGVNNGDTPSAIGSTVPPQGAGASGGNLVTSVFGRIGAVIAALSDYDASQVDNDSTVAGATVENALDTLLGLIGDPATKEAFFSPQQDDNIGDYRTRTIGGAGAFEFSFVVPHDFTSIISLEMILTPASNVTAENIDLTSDYGPDAGSIIAFSETDITNVVTFTAGDWNVMDISSVFSSLAAGHRCGIELDHQGIGSTVHYLFLRLRYS